MKKMRKFENGGLSALSGLDSMRDSSSKKSSSFSEAHDKAKRVGLTPGSEDYRKVIDQEMRTPNERSQNQALAKVKNTMGMKKGGKVSSASKRADGIAIRGKTRI